MDRVFPRTKFAAAVRSVSRVAQLSHDAAIGRGEVTHLFRAPQIEEATEDYLSVNETDLIKFFSPKLDSIDELIQLLSGMANGIQWPKQSGPVRLTASQWGDFHVLSAIYLQGFINKTPIYPYFAD